MTIEKTPPFALIRLIDTTASLTDQELQSLNYSLEDIKSARKIVKDSKTISKKKNGKWVVYRCGTCGKQFEDFPESKVLCEHEDADKKKKFYCPCYPINFIFSEVPSSIKQIVSSKNYFDVLFKETFKRIVGEESAKKVSLIVNNGGRLVINSKPTSYNILFSGQSGEGKDYTAENLLKILPSNLYHHKTRISDKALSYWHPSEKEPYYSWDGQILYCEDASNPFLNSDTVKVMMSGGSDISVVYDGVLKNLKINGSPIFVVTSATAEPNKELTRRVSSLSLDNSKEQTEKILSFQSKSAIDGVPEYDKDLIYSAYLLKRVVVKIPFAKELLVSFPKNIQARTNFDRFLDLIKASAALHQYSRENLNNEIIANLEDLKNAFDVFKILYPQRNISLTHNQTAILDYLKQVNAPKNAAEIFRQKGNFIYSQMGVMIEGLRSLASKGFIEISEGEQNGRVCDLYSYLETVQEEFDISNIIHLSSISDLTNITNLSDLSKEKEDTNLGHLGHLSGLGDLSIKEVKL